MDDLFGRLSRRLSRVLEPVTRHQVRRRARRRWAAAERPRRVLVVCSGNICRSPYAAAALERELASRGVHGVDIASAGFFGPERPAHDLAIAIGIQRGLDLRFHRSKVVSRTDAQGFDLAFVMTQEHRSDLITRYGFGPAQVELIGDFDTERTTRRDIPDPYGRPRDEFERVFRQVDRAMTEIAEAWIKTGLRTGK